MAIIPIDLECDKRDTKFKTTGLSRIRRRQRMTPAVEVLEDRILSATFLVTSAVIQPIPMRE